MYGYARLQRFWSACEYTDIMFANKTQTLKMKRGEK